MINEFRDFILRGNLVELAVAVVIGTAFAAVVAALVADPVTPLIAAVGGQQGFSDLTFTINGSEFRYGHFINALIAFLIIAAATSLCWPTAAPSAPLRSGRPRRLASLGRNGEL